MVKTYLAAVLCAVTLAGCGDPMRDVERLSEVEIAEDAEKAPVMAPKEERADAPGFFEGFFAGRAGGGSGGLAEGIEIDLEPGKLLPFGQIGRVCGLPRRELGKEVARMPDSRSGYRLYDPIPNSTAVRTQYITGFDDGCPRQVTGALALFGNAETHEQVRYQPSNKDIPYTSTDSAYEKIKGRVCGSGQGKPCGARLGRLEKDTAFLSVYQSFGGGDARWVEILLHGGAVAAIDLKGR